MDIHPSSSSSSPSSPLTPFLVPARPSSREEAAVRAAGRVEVDTEAHAETHTESSADKQPMEQSSGQGVDEHTLDPDEVARRYDCQVNFESIAMSFGLSQGKVQERLQRDGPNELSPPKRVHPVVKYFKKLFGLFNSMLIVSGILGFILYIIDSSEPSNLYLGCILLAVAGMNAGIEFYQEYKSEAILEGFKKLVPAVTMVIREGQLRECPAVELVVGDIVVIKAGDKVPADFRVIAVSDFKVDNSSVTGESEAQERHPAKSASPQQPPLEAHNLAFSGTLAVCGEATGIVIRTGDRSMLGQIAKLTGSESMRKAQLTVETDTFVKKTAVVAVTTAVAFLVYSLISGFSTITTISVMIGVFVSFIPQGLPATVTLLLTIAARRLAARNVLVKNLQGVETLGSITMLATDKTGTLTQNIMSVMGGWLNNTVLISPAVTDRANYDYEVMSLEVPNMQEILEVASLCSKSKYSEGDADRPLDERQIFGDATEIGLLRFAGKFVSPPELRRRCGKVFEIPFSSVTKWHLSVHNMEHGHMVMMIKGAPERVFKLCKTIRLLGQTVPINADYEAAFNDAYELFAKSGQRVLAFARKRLDDRVYRDYAFKSDPINFPIDDFTFHGLLSLMDPPKKGVRRAVAACRTAGIQVVMVTGDHPLTAAAIAKQIGLITGESCEEVAKRTARTPDQVRDDEYDAIVIHGDRIDQLRAEDWDRVFSKKEVVFARTSPKHKLEIVTRAQQKGHIVGVSGDGVNDSPALKKADLGIAMSKSGSDVSKEAAEMILLDDNFASIVSGIAEGRLIFANLKKSIRYTLTHITPQLAGFMFFVILQIPAPITSMLALFVDLGTEMGPSVSLAWEPPEGDLMLIPPRKVLMKPLPEVSFRDLEAAGIASQQQQQQAMSKPRQYWGALQRWFAPDQTGEVLIDSDMIIWSYLEGGIIEGLGCFGAYLIALAVLKVPFGMLINSAETYWKEGAPALTLTDGSIADADRQIQINGAAKSAFFWAIVLCQAFNLFLQKHRYTYPWGRDMLVNKYTYVGLCWAFAVAAIITFVPWINWQIFGCYYVPAVALLGGVAAGVFLYAWEVARRYLRRRGFFGGVPKRNANLLELVRTTSTIQYTSMSRRE